MTPIEQFQLDVKRNIEEAGRDSALGALTWDWIKSVSPHHYTHNFTWLGRPIIQFPQDIVAIQELVWRVKPDLIIETGIAHGGSLILSASLLALLEYEDSVANFELLDPATPRRKVIGIDIDIREHNRQAIKDNPMASRIEMIQGSSIDSDVIARVHRAAAEFNRILVILDSNHTHQHVLAELEAYAPLTSKGSYCLVFDTAIEDVPAEFFDDRPWGPGNNPKTAVWEYLKQCQGGTLSGVDGNILNFEIDRTIEQKILITVAPDGYLKRVE